MEDITKAATSHDDVIKSKTSVAETEQEKKVIIIISPGGAVALGVICLCTVRVGTKEEMRATEGKVKHKRRKDLLRQ